MSARPPERPATPELLEPGEVTSAELGAFMDFLRDREHMLRRAGTWAGRFPETELLESMCSKLRRRHHARHTSLLAAQLRITPPSER